ncbi:MAG TPA: MBL fold metallo-hydrolase [Clostridia bacterium]|nr:MBL fold metallo-hydrolase [Clostridia bacterium]
MKKKKPLGKLSRRRFLAVGSVSLAGAWAAYSDQLGARAMRGFVAETRRSILSPDYTPSPEDWNPNGITAAWLGHSTVLINFYGMTILTDPVLLKRVGADTLLGTIGAKRLVAPALKASQLPEIDLVVLSHAHMDHLDFATLRALKGELRGVSAKGTLDLLQGSGLKSPEALAWGDKTRIKTAKGDIEVKAFEVKHWGARWRYDRFRGYNGYVLEREGKRLIFGGDTAETDSFRSLRSKGPFELAIMPIGAYHPWVCSHCTPEQAVEMANGAGARYFLPIHHKTFPLGREGTVEPMQRLQECIESERIGWHHIGQTFVL